MIRNAAEPDVGLRPPPQTILKGEISPETKTRGENWKRQVSVRYVQNAAKTKGEGGLENTHA
jgi:hypothetical protein